MSAPWLSWLSSMKFTQPFNPTDDEQALYERISAFLQKEDSYALPKQQRHLTGLILRKLLASSSHAVAATLVTIRERLQGLLTADQTQDDGSQLVEQLIAEDDLEQDYLEEEASEAEENAAGPRLCLDCMTLCEIALSKCAYDRDVAMTSRSCGGRDRLLLLEASRFCLVCRAAS